MKPVFLFFSLSVLVCSCEPQYKNTKISGPVFGTSYGITYYSETEEDFREDFDSLFSTINKSLSTYKEDSEISKINRNEATNVDAHFITVFNESKHIFKETEGAFDPTIGAVVNAWNFGPKGKVIGLDELKIDSLMASVGLDKVNLSGDRVIKENPNTFIDFNAIAKGYAIDVIAEYFDEKNVSDYLIELGGELVAKGRNKQKDSDWIVAIDDPEQDEGERAFQTILALKNKAMATSGNYRKFKTDSLGNTFVHTINPLTGRAEKNDLLSASVLAENCTLADAYASAFMAMGFEKALALLEKLENVDAYFIYVKKGEPVVYATEDFKKVLRD